MPPSRDNLSPIEVPPTADAWFAVRTHSRAEKTVRDYLIDRQVEVFLPTVAKWSRWKDRKKKIDWPLFQGYCFARFKPQEQLVILKCPRVANIVSFAGHLMPVEDHEIDALRSLMASELQFDPAPFLKEGMRVEVIHGPLKGVIGRLIRKGDHARLVLSVELIAQAVSVIVDAADVKPY